MFPSHTTPRSICAGALALLAALAIGALATMTSHALASDGAASGAGTVAEVPELPFEDNPDPDECGIPTPLGEGFTATLVGTWEGELLFSQVHLYNGHLRSRVTGLVPSGTEVELVMHQNNPVLDYWFVRWQGPDGTVEGWAPDPFVRRDG